MGFCFGLESCVVVIGLPLRPHATSPFWGQARCVTSKQWLPLGQGMYFEGHTQVDLVTSGLSKWVGGCHGVMFMNVQVRNLEISLRKLVLQKMISLN